MAIGNNRNRGMLMLGVLFSVVGNCMGLSLTVNEMECLYENVEYEGDTISGNFVVVNHDAFWRSESPGVDFAVTAPGGNVLYNLKGSTGEKFHFRAPRTGMYKFCFYNSYSVPETISFYVHVGHIPSEQNLAKDEHLDPINVRIAQLREALESASAEQRYLKARDTQHRYTNESTRRRLIGYTLAEYVALIFASGAQVFLIRRMFGRSIAYNRV